MTTAPLVSVSRCSQVQPPTLPCGWPEAGITLMLFMESQVSRPKSQWKRLDKRPFLESDLQLWGLCRPSVEAGLPTAVSAPHPSALPSAFPFLSLPPLPCWSSLPLYQDPLVFTCSHKGTKEDKGLWTPLLCEDLPFHLVRGKEVRPLSP